MKQEKYWKKLGKKYIRKRSILWYAENAEENALVHIVIHAIFMYLMTNAGGAECIFRVQNFNSGEDKLIAHIA